jgi:hypothetical protein
MSTSKKLKEFKTIFSSRNDVYFLISHAVYVKPSNNPVLSEILSSINSYLLNNKGAVSDFHLMKDIVDRNCDAKEEEIDTQIPVPLYLGLIGTMTGVLIGIGYLAFNGDLNNLLGGGTGNGFEGVQILLVGVALTMISSVLGILLTTKSSLNAKNCKVEFEHNKNIFLSWIQSELFPTLSDNVTATLERMSRNLSAFNDTFSSNTVALGQTLDTINKTAQNQAVLLKELEKLKIIEIATENVRVYEKLTNCTTEIGQFAVYMQNVNDYLANVQALNRKLDDYEQRTQIIEKAGEFFDKHEKWLSDRIDSDHLEMQDALTRVRETMNNALKQLSDALHGQVLDFVDMMKYQKKILQEQSQEISEVVLTQFKSLVDEQISIFAEFMERQREMLQENSQELSKIISELKNLTAVKDSMSKLEKATVEQNNKIDKLVESIKKLAETKDGNENSKIKVEIPIPLWVKIVFCVVAIIIVGRGAIFLVQYFKSTFN